MKTLASDPEVLTRMLTGLNLTAIRDQLDSLLDTATRRKLTLLDTVKLLCEAEVARKDERRIQMASSIAKFPFARTVHGFEFAAQPSLDAKLIRELATCRWVGNGDALLDELVYLPLEANAAHLFFHLYRAATSADRCW